MECPAVLGGIRYTTKSQVKARAQAILRAYAPGTSVSNADDYNFLLDLIDWHPNRAAKVGAGVRRFEVRRNAGMPSAGFFVVRVDGTDTDFSYNECITPSSHRGKVIKALRYAIIDQVMEVADLAFAGGGPVRCAITGAPLHQRSEAHVDHEDPTFIELATAFAESVGGFEVIAYTDVNGIAGTRLTDASQADQWRAYHHANAKLRVVSVQANLTRGK